MGSSSDSVGRKNDEHLNNEGSLDLHDNNIINQNHIKGASDSISKNQMKKIIEQMDKSICKIEKEDITGTGFICIISHPDKFHRIPVLFTCHHILGNDDLKNQKEIKLIFSDKEKIIKLDESRKIYTSKESEYDTSIIELKEEDEFNEEDLLEVDNDLYREDKLEDIYKNKSIYTIHYEKGKEAKHSLGTIVEIESDNIRFKHKCLTKDGSSGAPILNLETYNVIGIHLGVNKNYDYNIGILIKSPINAFNELYPPNIKNNEILLTLKVEKADTKKKIYFLDNSDDNDEDKNKSNNNTNCSLKELNETKVKIFLDEKEINFSKFFEPKKDGNYEIKLKFLSLMTNCSCMFYKCSNIKSIDLSSFETKNVENMSCMFANCNKLKEIDLSSLNTENVTNMSAMFSDCNNLKSLDLSSFNTQNVKDMSCMFSNCEKLKEIDLSSFDTKNVINMSAMFANCKTLKEIDLSSFNTENLKDISAMLLGCDKLKSINLSSFNTENIKDMSALFFNCNKLKSIDLSSFKTENVEDMNSLLFGCNSLKSIDLSSFNTKNVSNMREMFGDCLNLKSIDLSSFKTDKVVEMKGMFVSCKTLSKLDLSSFNTKNVKDMSGMFYDCENLKKIDLNSFDFTNVKEINGIFGNCNNLTKVKINKNSFEILKKEIDKKKLSI